MAFFGNHPETVKKGKEKESHSLMAAFPVVAGIPCFATPDRSGYPGQSWRLPCLQISSPGALLRHCFRPILGSPCSVCFSRYLRECLSRQRGVQLVSFLTFPGECRSRSTLSLWRAAMCLSLTGKAIVAWANPIIKSRFLTFSCHFYMG